MGIDGQATEILDRASVSLRRALTTHVRSEDVADAVGEAIAYGWEHRERLVTMDNPTGYLYRVAQSHTRRRRSGFLIWPEADFTPEVEPGLVPALRRLPDQQLRAVWLVVGCGWSHREVGEALGVTASTISTHVCRGLESVRAEMGVVSS